MAEIEIPQTQGEDGVATINLNSLNADQSAYLEDSGISMAFRLLVTKVLSDFASVAIPQQATPGTRSPSSPSEHSRWKRHTARMNPLMNPLMASLEFQERIISSSEQLQVVPRA